MGASHHKEVMAFSLSVFRGFNRDKKAVSGVRLNSSEDHMFKSHGGWFTSLGIVDSEFGLKIMDIGNGKATEFGSVEMVHAEVLVVEFIKHGAIGRTGNKVDVLGDGGGFVGEDFDHQFTDLVDMSMINLDLDSSGRGFFVVLSIWDIPRNKANFEVGSLGFHGVLNDLVDGIMALVCRGHLTEKTGSGNIVGGRKTVSAKEAVLVFEPGIEGGVLLELPERGRGADTNEEMDDGGVAALPGHCQVLDTTNILVDGVTRGDVTFHGKNTISGCFVDREDDVVGVGSLQNREKVCEEHLDRK